MFPYSMILADCQLGLLVVEARLSLSPIHFLPGLFDDFGVGFGDRRWLAIHMGGLYLWRTGRRTVSFGRYRLKNCKCPLRLNEGIAIVVLSSINRKNRSLTGCGWRWRMPGRTRGTPSKIWKGGGCASCSCDAGCIAGVDLGSLV